MCIACCDPKKIEQVTAPNCFTILASSQQTYTTQRDALVIVISGGHYTGTPIRIRPRGSSDTNDACAFFTQGRASGFIPGAGDWTIENAGASAVKVMVLDAYCGAAFRAFARTGYAVPTHATIALDATPFSTLALAANQLRSYALIQSPSANTVKVFLAFGPSATANAGIELSPGSSYEMAGDNLWRGVINAILPSATAAQTLLVTEGA